MRLNYGSWESELESESKAKAESINTTMLKPTKERVAPNKHNRQDTTQ